MGDADEVTPVGWLESVQLQGSDELVLVTLVERNGQHLLLRQVDPDEPRPDRIPIYPGDEFTVMQAVSHIGTHTTPDVGTVSDLLFHQRVVPVRREPGRIVARTLRRDETDTGRRVHVRPGEQVVFEEGGIELQLDYLDDLEPPTESGYVPLAPSLWTWLTIGEGHDEARTRYLLSAARRLDAANLLLIEIERRRTTLNEENLIGPEIRRNFFQLIGSVELAIVGLGRAVDMVGRASTLIGCNVPVPAQIQESKRAINAIRNAYEHIEDRALGRENKQPSPDALTIFDYKRLLDDDVVVYGTHELELTTEVPLVVAAVRQFLKDAAANG